MKKLLSDVHPQRGLARFLAVFACLAAAVLAAPHSASAIAGGQNLDWPTNASGMATVKVSRTDGDYLCSGFLVSTTANNRASRAVLTARHCFTDPETDQYDVTIGQVRVYIGSNNVWGGDEYTLSAWADLWRSNPQIGNVRTDTTILQLSTELRNPALAFEYNDTVNYGAGTPLRANGYGYVGSDNGDQYLKQGTFEIVSNNPARLPATHTQIVGRGATLCKGDSGGPVIDANGIALGTVDAGPPVGIPPWINCNLAHSNDYQDYSRLFETNIDDLMALYE